MRYRLLDAFRGIAALWVVLHHYAFCERIDTFSPFLSHAFKAGHFGVPMFFVISGYCLMASASASMARKEAPLSFLYRRLRRIYPPFWFSILVGVSLPFFLELISSLKTRSYVWPTPENQPFLDFTVLHWLELVTLTRAFVPLPETTLIAKFSGFSNVYWSLAIEVQFYVVVALALAGRIPFRLAMLIVTALSAVCIFVPGSFDSGLFLPYWPAFAFGAGLYFSLSGHQSASRWLGRTSLPCFALFLALAAAAVSFVPDVSENLSFLGFSALFAVFLWFLHDYDDWLTVSVRSAGMRVCVCGLSRLGLISYSVYLLHTKFFHIADVFGRQIPGDSLLEDGLRIAITIALCIPFYWLCERPFAGPTGRKPADLTAHTNLRPARTSQ